MSVRGMERGLADVLPSECGAGADAFEVAIEWAREVAACESLHELWSWVRWEEGPVEKSVFTS